MVVKKTHLGTNKVQKNLDEEGRRIGVPIRVIIPNIITILAICCGMNAVRFALNEQYHMAIVMMIFSAFLDGIDGRVARVVNGESIFGEQLDSLADVISFGVVPPFILYLYILAQVPHFGWIAALIFCIACCLRLARFNAGLITQKKSSQYKNYFMGIPAPAGAMLVMLPIYIGEGFSIADNEYLRIFSAFYVLFIAFLMISRFPIYSGKSLGKNVRFEIVLLLFLTVVVYFGLLFSFFWMTLFVSVLIYFISIPVTLLVMKYSEKF